jgi:hypothetical protein
MRHGLWIKSQEATGINRAVSCDIDFAFHFVDAADAQLLGVAFVSHCTAVIPRDVISQPILPRRWFRGFSGPEIADVMAEHTISSERRATVTPVPDVFKLGES